MRIVQTLGTALIGAVAFSSTVYAANAVPIIPLSDLFGNPEKFYSSISPDGKWVSWVAPVNGIMNLWVAPRGQMASGLPVTQDTGRGISLNQDTNAWSYDGRHLVYVQDHNGNGNTHLYAVDINARTTRDLTPFDNVRVTMAAMSPKIPGEVLISLNMRDPKNPDLYSADLGTGTLTLVAENSGFQSFLTTDRFVPALALKLKPTGGEDVLRFENGTWINWLAVAPEDTRSTSFLAVDTAGKSVFALESRGRNTGALVRIDLATGTETLIAQDSRADIRDVILNQNTNEPLAYAVNTSRLEHRALSPAVKPDIDFLNQHNLGEWTVNSRSIDDRYWKLTSITDFYFGAVLYDRKAKTVTRLYDPRPQLSAAPLAHMYPATIKARDGIDLISYVSLPLANDIKHTGLPDHPIPLVLVVHGGPHDRDVYGFNAVHQWLANRGYAVLSVNMRGSTGFGKDFLNASSGEWGTKLDDDLSDAVASAIRNNIADPARIAIMGGSYGGYAVLRGMTRNPRTYACGIDQYGISDLLTMQGPTTTYGVSALNHNEVGDPSTPEGQARMNDQSPLTHADQIRSALLVAQGANDPAVKPYQSEAMVAAVKAHGTPVTYLLYPDEGHGFARAENNLSFYAVAEQFLAKCLGGRAEPITADSLKGSSMQVLEGADQIEGLKTVFAAQQETPG